MDLQYKIIYSNRKTIGISIERDRNIILRVPAGTKNDTIEEFVKRNKRWISRKVTDPRKYNKIQKTEFISGAAILYLGSFYNLEITKDELTNIVFDNTFKISQKMQYKVNSLFKDWFIERAKEYIPLRVEQFAYNIGVIYGKIVITDLKHKWGICTKNNDLKFNWRLIKAPLYVIDYVVLHELAHIIEPNHTNNFWRIIKVQIPNYMKAKEWLTTNGLLLEIDF